VFPGQGVAGFVYLPIDPGAAAVWLGLRIHGLKVWFAFNQVVVSATPAHTRSQWAEERRDSD
jgi:hypothetical protein